MSYSPNLNSGFANTRNRSPYQTSTSGMCSMCVEGCATPCDIGLAAVLQGLVPVKPTDKVCFLVSGGNVAFEQLKVFEEVEI